MRRQNGFSSIYALLAALLVLASVYLTQLNQELKNSDQENIITNQNPCQWAKCQVGYRCAEETGLCVKIKPEAGEYRCSVPCTGAAPSEQVERDCPALKTETECRAYKNAEFPYRCAWVIAGTPCLAP